MLLRDLLDDPELGLVLLSGEEGLDRPVRGVYITDLLDPRRYLDGGEVVLTGLVWHSGPEDSEAFVSAIAEAGVAGLASGTARLGHAPADLVEACRRHGVPVFEVPLAVSFNTLSERILREQRREAAPRRELVTAVASGADLSRVLEMACSELGADCWVVSGAGWVVGGEAELGEAVPRELIKHVVDSGRLPSTVGVGEESFVAWPLGADSDPWPARWFVAVRGDQQEWGPEHEAVATDLGTAVALLRTRIDEARQIASRSVEAALRGLLDGTVSSPEVAARLETAGLPIREQLRVVVLRVGERSSTAAPVLRELAAATGLASVTATIGDGALALFVDHEEQLSALDTRLAELAHDLEPGLRGLSLTIGLSDVSTAAGLRGLVEEASYARRLAEQRPGRIGIATGAELASHQVLLASVPDELRRSYRQRVLSPLVAYDRAHNSDLVRTLHVFLECSGSWSRCSKQLHVHVNTLRYRIQRIEEITGRDLGEFPTRVDFYLALQLG